MPSRPQCLNLPFSVHCSLWHKQEVWTRHMESSSTHSLLPGSHQYASVSPALFLRVKKRIIIVSNSIGCLWLKPQSSQDALQGRRRYICWWLAAICCTTVTLSGFDASAKMWDALKRLFFFFFMSQELKFLPHPWLYYFCPQRPRQIYRSAS